MNCARTLLAVVLLFPLSGCQTLENFFYPEVDVGTVEVFVRAGGKSEQVGLAVRSSSDSDREGWALRRDVSFPLTQTYQIQRVDRNPVDTWWFKTAIKKSYNKDGDIAKGTGGSVWSCDVDLSPEDIEKDEHVCSFELMAVEPYAVGGKPGKTFGYMVLRRNKEDREVFYEMWCLPSHVGFPLGGSLHLERLPKGMVGIDKFSGLSWHDLFAEMQKELEKVAPGLCPREHSASFRRPKPWEFDDN